MSTQSSEIEVQIDHTDPETGRRFDGTFSFKRSLSMADQQQVGRIRRQIMGGGSVTNVADETDLMYAQFQAEIQVRAIEPVPAFWAAKQGSDLPPELIKLIGDRLGEKLEQERAKRASAAKDAQGRMRQAQS